ncbi:MAG: S8 family peptidase [Candidatus Margulisiibacteriota bacterium]
MTAVNTYNDPLYKYQWHFPFLKLDQINMPPVTTKPIIVAILDTGLDRIDLVPDESISLFTNKYSNPKFYNDTNGYNFVYPSGNYYDDDGHGTAIASIIASKPNNNYGLVGINNNVKIWPLKVLDSDGWGDTGDIIVALQYIKETMAGNFPNKADGFYLMINMSFGGADYSETFQSVVDDLYTSFANVYIFAAAGNGGGVITQYPAGYKHVLSIGSCDDYGDRSYFSTHAPDLFCVAPGEAIPVILPDQTGESWDGTSFSCPITIGLFSRIISQYPDASRGDILSRFKESCSFGNSPAKNLQVGWGYPNMIRALEHPLTITPVINSSDRDIYFFPNPIKVTEQGRILSAARSIRIYDILGHLIDEFTIPDSSEKPYSYSIANFAPGIYYMVDVNDFNRKRKFIVYK